MAWPNVYGLDTGQLQRRATARQLLTILIIHDAFHTPAHFAQLQVELANAGFRVLIPQLPSSSGFGARSVTLEDDVRTIVECGQTEINGGANIMMVLHGYGSIPGCAAAERLNQYSLDRPRTGYVTKLVMVAGVVSRPNESYYDSVEASWAIARDGLVGVQKPDNIFYNDCSQELKTSALSSMRPQSESSLWAKSTSQGWTRIPTLYIVCELDNAIPAHIQRGFVQTLQTSNRQTAVASLGTGHSPFLSRTRDLAAMIIRASS